MNTDRSVILYHTSTVANDTIFDTFGIISSGFLSPEETLRLLKVGPEYTEDFL